MATSEMWDKLAADFVAVATHPWEESSGLWPREISKLPNISCTRKSSPANGED